MEAVWRAGLRTRRGGSRGSPASVLVLAGVNAVPRGAACGRLWRVACQVCRAASCAGGGDHGGESAL